MRPIPVLLSTIAILAPTAASAEIVGDWRYFERTGAQLEFLDASPVTTTSDGLINMQRLTIFLGGRGGYSRGSWGWSVWEFDCDRRRAKLTLVAVFDPNGPPPFPAPREPIWYEENPSSRAMFDAVCTRSFGEPYGRTPQEVSRRALELNPQ